MENQVFKDIRENGGKIYKNILFIKVKICRKNTAKFFVKK